MSKYDELFTPFYEKIRRFEAKQAEAGSLVEAIRSGFSQYLETDSETIGKDLVLVTEKSIWIYAFYVISPDDDYKLEVDLHVWRDEQGPRWSVSFPCLKEVGGAHAGDPRVFHFSSPPEPNELSILFNVLYQDVFHAWHEREGLRLMSMKNNPT